MADTRLSIYSQIKPKWDQIGDHPSHASYIKYLQSLSLAEQIHKAKKNDVIAQRMLATHYYDQEEYETALFWGEKALANKDPITLIERANLYIQQGKFQEAKSTCNEALLQVHASIDKDFISAVVDIADETLMRVAVVLFNEGLKKHKAKDLVGALNDWKQASDFDPNAAYNSALLLHKNHNLSEAIFYVKLALFLSTRHVDKQNFRGVAHNLLGMLLAEMLPKKCSYIELLEVVTHAQKAIAYSNGDKLYKSNLDGFMRSISDENIKNNLLKDSEVLSFKNGIFKTVSEMLSHPTKTEAETQVWLAYEDPRKDVNNVVAAKPSVQGFFAATVEDKLDDDCIASSTKSHGPAKK